MMKSATTLATLALIAGVHGQYVSKKMPNFVLKTIDGKTITNQSLKGKIVVFDFWATWCGPCKMASPAMQKLYTKFKGKGVVVIGADTMENSPGPKGAITYKAGHKYDYVFTYNSDRLSRALGVQAIPAFALIDQNGYIRDAVTGLPPGGPNALYTHFVQEINTMKKG